MNAISPSLLTANRLRSVLVAAVICDIVLICLRVLLYIAFFQEQNALIYLFEPIVLLLAYAGITFATTAQPSPARSYALCIGATFGLLTGAMWILNLTLETFSAASGILVSAPFLLCAFLLWAGAGFLGARHTASLTLGVVAALWAAMSCVLLTITFGLLLTFTSLSRLERLLVADPDFLRSHWGNLRAFAIANTFESAFSHLLGALLIGSVFGGLGGLAGRLTNRRGRPRTFK